MVGKGGEGRRREGRAGDGKFALAPSKYIWIDAAGAYPMWYWRSPFRTLCVCSYSLTQRDTFGTISFYTDAQVSVRVDDVRNTESPCWVALSFFRNGI